MTIWRLGDLPVAGYEAEGCWYDVEPLDGDLRNAGLADPSVDIGKWPIVSTEIWQSGRPIDTESLPKSLLIRLGPGMPKGEATPVRDYMKVGTGAQLCSQKFVEVVNKFDLGVHQFEKVSIQVEAGNIARNDFYWFAPGNRIFALDPSKTRPPMVPYKTGPGWHNPHDDRPAMRMDKRQSSSTWEPAFFRNKIGERHLFCDGEFGGFIFMSDELKRSIEDSGLIGVGPALRFGGPFLSE